MNKNGEDNADNEGDEEKVDRAASLSSARFSATTSTFKRLAIDRFVLAHFFLLFFVSFIIGVVFLHSTLTLWQWQVVIVVCCKMRKVQFVHLFSS